MLKKITTLLALLATTAVMAAVDVNKATEADLNGIKGVGPATSKSILTERKKGEFKDWTDLMGRVKGIGEARAVKLSTQGLTVAGAPYRALAPAPAAAAKGPKK